MYAGVQKLITRLCYLFVILGIVAYLRKDRLPDYTAIDPALREQPTQIQSAAPEFQIEYKGKSYRVRPKANYTLTGLIVSQNNPTGIADIYHDSKSLDTKDFCVIWGHNVRSNEFKDVTYWSGAWTCYCQWDDLGLRFWTEELSNNHLITDSDLIRRKIARSGIGDQIQIKGQLVDYKEVGTGGGWRSSSLVRTDTGNGACEVIFVRELSILRSTNAIWRKFFLVSLIMLATALISKALLFFAIGSKRALPN
ncbi:MAG: hypothetical protein ACSHX4_09060 [Opitutaceae bacterium]